MMNVIEGKGAGRPPGLLARVAERSDETMRIIAGQRRGHKFDGPKGGGTRPTSDLVRESLFNILGAEVADRIVIDLFAGTGALGLEALSRGAVRAIFVERNRDNVALIYRNLATLRFEDRARVLNADAYRWARTFEPIDDEPLVVFLDPPYREYEDRPREVRELLEQLGRRLPSGSLIAAESSRHLDGDILPELSTWDIRRYGGTQIAIRTLSPGAGEESASGPPVGGASGGGVDDADR
jgi:16S rRNA (guanine966-N2)-methyltransferase